MQINTAEYKQINKQFANYVIPSVIAMSIQAFYTVLNGIIAGQGLGELALGAVNIALPFNMVIIALSMLIGERGILRAYLIRVMRVGKKIHAIRYAVMVR